LEYPILKVLYQDRSPVSSNSDDDFYDKKLNILKMLITYGADISKVKESYSYHIKINIDEMKERNLINDEIIEFLKLSQY
jgi:hypothetical protein